MKKSRTEVTDVWLDFMLWTLFFELLFYKYIYAIEESKSNSYFQIFKIYSRCVRMKLQVLKMFKIDHLFSSLKTFFFKFNVLTSQIPKLLS